MIFKLDEKESKILFDVVDTELGAVINEYDSDTCRRPSKKRTENGKYAKSILTKWSDTQPKIAGTDFIPLDEIVACDIDLSDKEVSYVLDLLIKCRNRLRKYLEKYEKPYTGALASFDNAATCAEKLINRFKTETKGK